MIEFPRKHINGKTNRLKDLCIDTVGVEEWSILTIDKHVIDVYDRTKEVQKLNKIRNKDT